MIEFRDGFYADVRTEDRCRTTISYQNGVLMDLLVRTEQRAFLRVSLGYGVRHTFGVAVHTDDDEVARLAALSDERCLQL